MLTGSADVLGLLGRHGALGAAGGLLRACAKSAEWTEGSVDFRQSFHRDAELFRAWILIVLLALEPGGPVAASGEPRLARRGDAVPRSAACSAMDQVDLPGDSTNWPVMTIALNIGLMGYKLERMNAALDGRGDDRAIYPHRAASRESVSRTIVLRQRAEKRAGSRPLRERVIMLQFSLAR